MVKKRAIPPLVSFSFSVMVLTSFVILTNQIKSYIPYVTMDKIIATAIFLFL